MKMKIILRKILEWFKGTDKKKDKFHIEVDERDVAYTNAWYATYNAKTLKELMKALELHAIHSHYVELYPTVPVLVTRQEKLTKLWKLKFTQWKTKERLT